jgi:hypothetical protein
MCPQRCFLATAAPLSPVYRSVASQWVKVQNIRIKNDISVIFHIFPFSALNKFFCEFCLVEWLQVKAYYSLTMIGSVRLTRPKRKCEN